MDVGKAGENYFSFLCNTAEIISNRSLESDSHGWDHYVQFLMPNFALSEPLFTAQIQVKSTMNTSNTIQMDFQNLLKMSSYRYPSFIIFFKFEDDDMKSPKDVYIKHFDKDFISVIFKKISNIRSKKGAVNLKKHKMTIHFLDNEKLNEITGVDLKSRLCDLVGLNIDQYLMTKIDSLKFLEQQYSSTKISFDFVGQDIDAIQNAFLGFGKPIGVQNFYVTERDLGLEIEGGKNNYNDVEIIALPEKDRDEFSTLVFSGNIGFPNIEFESLFIASPINSFISKENVKVRYSHKNFDILLNPYLGKFTIYFKFLENELNNIDELYKVVYLAKYLGCSERLNSMTVNHRNNSMKCELSYSNNNVQVDELFNCLDNFCSIQKYVKSFDEKVEVSILEIMEQSERITLIKQCLDKTVQLRFEFSCDGLDTSSEIASLICLTLVLSERCYCFIFVVIGNAEVLAQDHFRIEAKEVTLIDSFVVKEKFTREELLPLLAKYEKNYSKDYFVIKHDNYLF